MTLRAEVDEVRLVRMQREAEPIKPFPQHVHDPLGVVVGLKGHHEVVGASYQSPFPLMRGRTTSSNHLSSTWCRKMFESIGEMTPPCGVPSVARCRFPASRTPAFSHLPIIRRMTPSVTRWSRISRRCECEIESKYLRTSTSSTQCCLLTAMAPDSWFSAWCADRPGLKPYEHDRKSCS